MLTPEELDLLPVAVTNWKRKPGVPTTIGDWLVRSSIGAVVKLGSVLLFTLED